MARVQVQEEENPAAAAKGGEPRQDVAVPDAGTLAWSGFILVAAAVLASWAGLVGEPGAALLAYALLLLGVAFVVLSMVAPPKLKMI